MKNLFLLILMCCLTVSVSADEGFASLEEQMTGDEFEASGLGKLSPQELDALNQWIRARSLATLDQPKAGSYAYSSAANSATVENDMRGFKESGGKRSVINSRITGTFSGWDGNTLFKLENGMIWAQTSKKDKFYIKPVDNPTVIIEPGMFGSWRLSVEDYSTQVKVERIQ